MRIFSGLGDRKDVAACRLVCRDFKKISSPYLITRVILAKRVDTVEKFYDIVEHPYFRKHVTELLYDASWYDSNLALEPERYDEVRGEEDTTVGGLDRKGRRAQYLALWDRVLRDLPGDARPNGLLEDTQDHSDDHFDSTYQMMTYDEYYTRYEDQGRIQETGMLSYALKSAFDNLPKLRHIVIGDYRNAASQNESHSQLCKRFFGDTLQPYGLGMDAVTDFIDGFAEDPQDLGWDDFLDFVQDLHSIPSDTRSRLISVSIGGHQYAAMPGSISTRVDQVNVDSDPAVSLMFGEPFAGNEDEDFDQQILGAFEGLQRLVLPVKPVLSLPSGDDDRDNSYFGRKFVRPMIQQAAPTVVHLELGAVKLFPFTCRTSAEAESGQILSKLLFNVDFPALRHLDLRGWVVESEQLKVFLSKMSTTLKELRLIYNLIEEPLQLARWGGENLVLDGVQMWNYDYLSGQEVEMDLYGTTITPGQHDVKLQEELWLALRRNLLPRENLESKFNEYGDLTFEDDEEGDIDG